MPSATSGQTIGPFWHLIEHPEWADLTRFGAEGERAVLTGIVFRPMAAVIRREFPICFRSGTQLCAMRSKVLRPLVRCVMSEPRRLTRLHSPQKRTGREVRIPRESGFFPHVLTH